MRIGIDARSLSNTVCGVSRVSSCLIQALSYTDNENEYIIYTHALAQDLKTGRNFRIVSTRCSRMNPLHDIKFHKILKKDKIDLYHVMHSWLPQFIPKGIKTVVTIHDLFSSIDPEFFVKYKPFHKLFQLYFKYLTKRSINVADSIVTVSNYCKKEIVKYFPLSNGKINVIYNAAGIDSGTINLNAGNRSIKNNYLLYVGNCRSYKNVKVLIKGFSIFLKKINIPDLKLIIAGNDACSDIRTMVETMGIEKNVVFLVQPSDEEINNLYLGALIFIFPSKYEGFGIPVVEAMKLGVPVIVSDAEALTEVVQDAALIFKKDSSEDLSLAMEKMFLNDVLRKELIEKGYRRAKEFTWEASAVKLRNLYQQVVNG